ncbi:hypothetical protein [Streptomyces sp. NPDC005167]
MINFQNTPSYVRTRPRTSQCDGGPRWGHGGFEVPGRAEPVGAGDLLSALADVPVIISVTEQFPDDGRKGSHLVIARGYTDGTDPDILIRDPSAWGQTHDRVRLSRLVASYTGRAITFVPLTAGRTAQ